MKYSSATMSTFNSLDTSFQALCAASKDLAIEGADVVGFQDRPIGLIELRRVLLRPPTSYEQRDAALGLVLDRAQSRGNEWVIGLAGMLLPGLRVNAWRLIRKCPPIRDEIESEMIIGLLHAMKDFSAGDGHLASRLIWRSRRGASRLVNDELKRQRHRTVLPESATTHRSHGHVDFVLERAVVERILRRDDAELIATTRFEGIKLTEAAVTRGISRNAVGTRRCRAEHVLRDWLVDNGLASAEPHRRAPRDKRSHHLTEHTG